MVLIGNPYSGSCKRECVEACLNCKKFVECDDIGKFEECADFEEVQEEAWVVKKL
jgi:hypothetical protein